MRATCRRLLATAAPAPRAYLSPGAPTGITGLLTHPSPRTHLLFLYTLTLARLRSLPESSTYRRATEALTRRRRDAVAAVVPAGHAAWQAKANEILDKNPDLFTPAREKYLPKAREAHDGVYRQFVVGGERFVTERLVRDRGERGLEWGGEPPEEQIEGPATLEERPLDNLMGEELPDESEDKVARDWPPEPKLDATQIAEVEERIGAGLIEEVIQVAEGELELVHQMTESKPWEELVEKPRPGQWEYFTRDRHTA